MMATLFGRTWTRDELMRRMGHIYQIAGVQLMAAEDGPARGVRYLEFRTGTGFNFKVAVERGMDVGYCEYRGASLAWIPSHLLPGPWYWEQQSEFGWLRTGLGGLNNTAGLVHIGNPEKADVSHYNFPARATEQYGVHDRIALTPGQLVKYGQRWEGDECILEAEGIVAQTQTYGENLALHRTYTARLGEPRFWMHDEVVNEGYLPTEHMLLYHINVGFPFVDEDAELVAPFDGPPLTPQGLPPPSTPDEYARFIAPQKDWLLQGFEFKMNAEADGRVPVAIVNDALPNGGQGMYVIYNRKQFPHYLEWRMMGQGQYAVGIEPCTNTFGREVARAAGELIVLQPGQALAYDIEVGILDGADAVQAFRERVRRL